MRCWISNPYVWLSFFLLATVYIFILESGIIRNFPCVDEIAHLPSGVSHWKHERFDMYRVNPPLVRVITTAGSLHNHNRYSWSHFSTQVGTRPEFEIGVERLVDAKIEITDEFIQPRRIAMVLSLFGMFGMFVLLLRNVGQSVAICGCAYWCLCPNLLAFGGTIVPDVGATVSGVFVCYCASLYVRAPKIESTILLGFGVGLALLTKLTWISLFISIPFTVCICYFITNSLRERRFLRLLIDLLVFWSTALLVLNVGYLFEDSAMQLRNYEFCSKVLGGENCDVDNLANRFSGTIWGQFPVPLPKNYVLGIDYLRYEVETRNWSFLMGEWKYGSWAHYYILTTVFKTPEPTLIAACLGLTVLIVGIRKKIVSSSTIVCFFFLGIPAVISFLSVSIQGGFNHHHRYVLMIYPFLFALAAYVASPTAVALLRVRFPFFGPKKRSIAVPLAFTLVALSAVSSLRVHPYYTSYFNTISGGPENGWRLLGFSNIDWGQDLLEVDEWIKEHPECRPLRFELDYFDVNGELFDLPPASPPRLPTGSSYVDALPEETEYWIISVKKLYNLPNHPGLEYLQQLQPVDRIAYAYHVYKMPGKNSPPPEE